MLRVHVIYENEDTYEFQDVVYVNHEEEIEEAVYNNSPEGYCPIYWSHEKCEEVSDFDNLLMTLNEIDKQRISSKMKMK